MEPNTNTAIAENTATDSHWTKEPWSDVMTAIVGRWPHLDKRDIETLPCDVFEIENFLAEFTDSSDDEIQAVLRKHAPAPSIRQRAEHLRAQVSERVLPPVQSSIERVQYEVDERPATVAGLIFVTGLALGALVTASFLKKKKQPTTVQSLLPRNWRS